MRQRKSIPGRPIVSAVNSTTENLLEFLTLCLKPLPPKLKTYIRDTKHFLSKILSLPRIPEEAILVTANVSSLYTNIPHKDGKKATDGIEATLHYIEKYKDDLPSFVPNTQVIKTLFYVILENNILIFDKKFYKEK